MVFIFKAIKPQHFDVDAFQREARAAAEAIGEGMLRDFQGTTQGWEHRVAFDKIVDMGAAAGGIAVLVGTDDEVYGYVDQGTRPHTIVPRQAKRLRFRTGYSPKTRPGNLHSRGRGGGRGDVVYARQVRHPGTKARGFSDQIHRKWKTRSKEMVQAALARAAERRV